MARIEDLKEVAPCGMNIRYTVDKDTDFVTYSNIGERGKERLQKACEHCSWCGICNPTLISKERLFDELNNIELKSIELAKYAEVLLTPLEKEHGKIVLTRSEPYHDVTVYEDGYEDWFYIGD